MYVPTENRLGIQPISTTSATPNHDLGTIVRARDQIYGEGEFIYLLGCAGTAIGSVVIWEGQAVGVPTYQTALAPATLYLAQPLAVAMSANVSAQYGWYQLGGQAVVKTNGTLAANVAVYLAGTGQLTSTPSLGLEVEDATSISASGTPSSGLAIVEIDRPFAQGAVGAGNIGTARLPASAATVNILTSDIEVGINTATLAVSCPLPSVAAWNAAQTNGLDLTIFDDSGNAATNNITPSLNGTDTFVQGVTPVITTNYGLIKLRPVLGTPNQWYVRGVN